VQPSGKSNYFDIFNPDSGQGDSESQGLMINDVSSGRRTDSNLMKGIGKSPGKSTVRFKADEGRNK